MMLILIDCCLPVLVVCLMSGEHAPCKNRTGVAKGLRDRNSPICTLSQNGYGGKSSVLFVLFNLKQKSPGMASQALGSMQDAPQDVGSIPKFGISAKFIGPTVRRAQGGQDKGALYRPLGSKRRRKHVFLTGRSARMWLVEHGGELIRSSELWVMGTTC